MTYAWVQDLPIRVDVYREILERLGDQAPEGLLLHVARVLEDGHLQYLDVWTSREACERFTEERLHPVVGQVLASHGIRPSAEPPRIPVEVPHVWSAVFHANWHAEATRPGA